MKTLFLILTTISFYFNNASAQYNVSDYINSDNKLSIAQFFLPSQGMNRTNYYNVDDKGQKMKLTHSRYYLNRTGPEILDMYETNGKSTSGTLQTLLISNDEISVKKRVNVENMSQESYDNKPLILLKLPKGPDDNVSWSYSTSDGTKIDNDAHYMVYTLRKKLSDGSYSNKVTPTLCIQVRTIETYEKLNRSITTIYHYLKGIGYFSSTIYNKTEGKFKDFENWEETVYDSKVK